MTDDNNPTPEDEFRDMLRDILSGKEGVDAGKLAGAAGLPNDPESLARLMSQLQAAMNAGGDAINWGQATDQAKSIAETGVERVTAIQRAEIDQAFHVASLWLADVTDVTDLVQAPRLITRLEWIDATMPLWIQLAEPVANSIANALTNVLTDQAPEEMKGMIAGASQLMKQIGGTLFAMQLGHVVGQLSTEVVSGGDVGIPLFDDGQAALVPQNMAEFGEGLDIPMDQVHLYLAVRELAHARLFRHARWLRLNLISSISDFSRGISIDVTRLEELAGNFDPANPEELRDAMANGALIPPKSEAQLAALARLETQLALIEGWVDVVTSAATNRLPRASAMAETVRRRRASGGPAESAFATLVGLELRPRRLREAAVLWQLITEAIGAQARDALWSHPDLMPTAEDLDNPGALVARLTAQALGEVAEPDEMDRALEDLLNGKDFDEPTP
ncbi:zinc-dependent metalloprotease [Alpinimonas psychrophila]|uniref:Putative hydrolase n=1 Tax=Alpinimonas psychrophila TaxID=748908 RepID=A0A7W3JS64_9MICO|nr:zinc-dependent metalloprotease [Alpinimonas psychrophila]MBA8828206.1 putative hydrolase [Alpinimonas psychrophila]